MNIYFVNSHPIQYYAPLYALMAKDQDINLQVIYLSDVTIKGYQDSEFKVNVKWDIPLLEGYDCVFLKNYSWSKQINKGFFSLINFGLFGYLRTAPRKSIIVVHGWATFSNMLAIYSARLFGHTVCLRGDTPYKQEDQKSLVKQFLKMFFFKLLLFPFIHKFLYVGTQNKLFYQHWGIADSKLIFTPFSVDNERFRNECITCQPFSDDMRASLNIDRSYLVIVCSGKYIKKKRPLDLLKAFALLKEYKLFLIMIGEGALRSEMEEVIYRENLSTRVLLTGFVNQSQISKYYSIADIFVMCSGIGETWGLSVNEAMNFELPLVISDITGSSDDLVINGKNGFVFKTGDVKELAEKIKTVSNLDDSSRKEMGKMSLEIVSRFTHQKIVINLKNAFARKGSKL